MPQKKKKKKKKNTHTRLIKMMSKKPKYFNNNEKRERERVCVGERQVQHPIAKKNRNNVYMYECSTNKKEMMMKKREKRKSLVLNKHCSSVRRAMI